MIMEGGFQKETIKPFIEFLGERDLNVLQKLKPNLVGPRFVDKGAVLESDRFIDGKSIYWKLTICKMTRYRRVKSKKGEEGI
jgi:hypothetical protein